MIRICFLALLGVIAHATAFAAPVPLTTVAERSGFQETGRYEEVIELCAKFARAYPDAVRCVEFGRTPEGRPMLALIASRSGTLDVTGAHQRKLPVLLIQGGIHAGEIDGKDAGFLVLREALEGRVARHALEKLVLVFVPVFNVDGHERFDAWNRPNQRGPREMGWRTTAQNYNLNRDYVKADSPEMRAMLGLIETWDPIVHADLHVTDGAQFEHDISVNIEPVYSGDADLRKTGRALRTDMLERLRRQGSLPLGFYPSFVVEDDPASGFEDGVPPPRFSHGYMPLRNRFGGLVETHSWKDYPTRVRGTHNAIVGLLELTARDGRQWIATAQAADARARQLGGSLVPLAYKASDRSHLIDFRGYAYTRTPSEISGALMTRYDEHRPQIWKIPLRDDVRPNLQVTAPTGGYIVPAAWSGPVRDLLVTHAIEFREMATATPGAALETFRATQVSFGASPVESHQRVNLQGQWEPERRDIPRGSLFVPIAQPKARLVLALFEPMAPDSLVAWGEFNGAFERKEYMEDYVAEEVARNMLRNDAALAEAFHRKLADDPAFAKDPAARLEFFARRHSSWDERYNLYPVLRSAVTF